MQKMPERISPTKKSKNKKIKKEGGNFFLYIVVLTAVSLPLAVWLYYRLGIEEVFSYIKALKAYQIFLLALFPILNLFLWSLRWRMVLESTGAKKPSLKPLFKARLGGMAVSYITPGANYGGELIRPLVIRKEAGISFKRGVTSLIIDRLIEGIVLGFLLVLGSTVFFAKGNVFWAVFCLVFGSLIGFGFFLFLKVEVLKKLLCWASKFSFLKKSSYKISQKIEFIGCRSHDFFRSPDKTFWFCVLLTLGYFLNLALQLKFFLFFVGRDIFFPEVIIARIITGFGGFFPTPASLGFYETAYVLGFSSIGLPLQLGLGFSLVNRFFDFIFVMLGMILMLPYLGKLIKPTFRFLLINNNGKNYFTKNKKRIS